MQQRVKKHFDALAQMRDGSSFPIFALEHDLSKIDLERIRSMVRLHPNTPPSSRHWLLWIVHATEVGYSYEGDEYWRSFEKQTPGWEYQNRPRIKAWFRKFQNVYGGGVPSGPWAEHFSIIAWPITHAILPRYLQRQFAKLLFDHRFQLASRTELGARSIGRLLAIHAIRDSKRFKVFLEQEELTGQIVLALLGGEPAEGKLIHPPTLRRIVADLERVRNAREWLRETQRVVSDRFKGIGRGTGPGAPRPERPPDPALPDTPSLSIRPSLFLRYTGPGRWSAFLQVKSFRPVAALSSEIRSFLNRTRCRLNGAHDFKPTGWLLSGNRKGALRFWPDPVSPLIGFEHYDPTMDHLLESECRLHPGPIWLFRIGADGIAHHIAGQIVRPDVGYIVVTTTLTPDNLEYITQCNLDCEGVNAYRLAIPSHVSAEMTSFLRKSLGLHVARTIRVWPAGMPGRGWDGEGSSEWLTTESPCFGIASDHPVESLAFRLNDDPETLIHTDGNDSPLFVRLPPLPVGIHKLTVKAKRSSELEIIASTPAAEGSAQLAVRDPEPWTPGVTSHPGLIVRVDPDQADLDKFWRNKINLSVNGPQGFTANFHVTLQSVNGGEILSKRVGARDLPIATEVWRRMFGKFLNDEAHAWKYLEATTCTLTIRADTLGTCTLRFEHEPIPIRWVIRSHRRNVCARLVDDTGQDETALEVTLFRLDRPFESAPLSSDDARSGRIVEPPGGLFVASHGPHRDIALVSAGSTQQGFQGLGVEPSFPELTRSAAALCEYFRLLALWRDARLFGFLASIRHNKVVSSAAGTLRAVLCGQNWAQAERRFSKQPGSQASLKSLASLVDKPTDFGTVLLDRSEAGGALDHAWFLEAATRKNVCPDRDLSEFALRLAREPLAIADHPDLELLLAKLIENPAILRAARLLTLLLSSASGDVPDANPAGRYST